MNEVQRKRIQVVKVDQRQITPKPGGKFFQPFIVYSVVGNDGINYETTDRDWFLSREIGEFIDLSYRIESRPGARGAVYTSYKVVVPPKSSASSSLTMEGMKKIYNRIEEMEKNILARLDMVSPLNVSGPEDLGEEPEGTAEELADTDEEEKADDLPF